MAKAKGRRYHELVLALIRRLLKADPHLTPEQLAAAVKSERARAGGYARAEHARARAGVPALADDAATDSYEELIGEVQAALQQTFGGDAYSVATYPDFVVFYHGAPTQPDADDDPGDAIDSFDNAWEEAIEDGRPDGDNDADDQDTFTRVEYTRGGDGIISFGTQTTVEKDVSFLPVDRGGDGDQPYEELIDSLEDAMSRAYGNRVRIVASYPDRVIYSLNNAGDDDSYFEQPYTNGDNGIELGDRQEVEMSVSWADISAEDQERARAFVESSGYNEPEASIILAAAMNSLVYTKAGASGSVKGGKRTLPANVQKLPERLQKMWIDVFNGTLKRCGSGKKCEQRAFAAANGVIKKQVAAEAGSNTPPQTPSAPEPHPAQPESISQAAYVLDAGTQRVRLPQRLAGIDWNNRGFAPAKLRLSDDAAAPLLPVWQQLHKIGKWVIPHASGNKIVMTREIGNKIIDNFVRNVVRRPIPLDFRHFTDAGGEALGHLKEIRWGSPAQGLPGQPDPDGTGTILYGRFEYNSLGIQKLTDRQFSCISPQYWLDYPDDETGYKYGPAIVAVAATNNPYLRVRTIQGEEAPDPVAVLEDGLISSEEGSEMSGSNEAISLQEVQARLERAERALVESEQRRVDSEHKQHVTSVQAYLDAEIRQGLSPALAKLAKPLLLHSEPEAAKVISLEGGDADYPHPAMKGRHSHEHPDAGVDDGNGDGKHSHAHTHNNDSNHTDGELHSHDNVRMLSNEPTHNLHTALKTLIAAIPRVTLGVALTHQDDERPYQPEERSTTLDDQLADDYARGLLKLARIDGPNADAILASTAQADEQPVPAR